MAAKLPLAAVAVRKQYKGSRLGESIVLKGYTYIVGGIVGVFAGWG